ncbi:ABC transporter ATP-binding protein [Spirochaeta isovalerica]|uniref:NitT/TauT family transport system ATP-binding protein n=1 Tax=Spirochaeta isovalerica TaxID=150 RepID=A0A841RCB6_9SPIO|nr:ABC transporter ATP-binding protein [Spirochaeta isovalerica]MBB6480308.1 NitT/TauT family transport system ATP-binding protein [Spirochaeta isovalerica]
MVTLKDVTLDYGPEKQIFNSFDYTFDKGKIHGIIGKSGCGKTSLLYLTAGLIAPQRGNILIGGTEASPGRRDISMILQDFGLFPWKSCRENLALGLKLRKTDRHEIRVKIDKILTELDLKDRGDSYPANLSGGERQRLAIGRALILEPDLLLLDEPFSSLDAMTRELLQERLLTLKEKSGRSMTVIHVTHSIEEAVFLSDTIHILNSKGEMHRVENNPSGNRYRTSPDFFEHCVTVRRELERRS